MVDKAKKAIRVAVPAPRIPMDDERVVPAIKAEPDRRPRLLRWLLPTACSSAVPLNGMQQAELKLIAYH